MQSKGAKKHSKREKNGRTEEQKKNTHGALFFLIIK